MNSPCSNKNPERHTPRLKGFLEEATALLGFARVLTDPLQVSTCTKNSLAYSKSVSAILYPKSKTEVSVLVSLALHFEIELYPVSRGRNIGYGEMSPPNHEQVIVSLEKMNRIFEFDPQAGEVSIEPGVSQEHLVKFLFEQGDHWIADVTGAPPNASLVGNTLDGGFGHTPLGNHREHILEAEVILGNGKILRTGRFPGLGPNLAPLLVQSNFGIVTSLRIPLLRKPESILTYLIQFQNQENFLKAIPVLQELRQLGVLQNLLHVANATRIFMSTNSFPAHLSKDTLLSNADCRKMMKIPLMTPPLWAGVGGLYGTKGQVKESMRILQARLKGLGEIQFFSDRKFKMLRGISRIIFWKSPQKLKEVSARLDSLASIHQLCQGKPSHRPFEHIHWKAQTKSDLGLIWISPVIKASGPAALKLIQLAEPLFEEFKFELPITMTFIDQAHLVCIINLCFDKSSPEQIDRAHRAYKQLDSIFSKNKIECYRKGILFQQSGIPHERLETIETIKTALDPKGIIAPGRYGIYS